MATTVTLTVTELFMLNTVNLNPRRWQLSLLFVSARFVVSYARDQMLTAISGVEMIKNSTLNSLIKLLIKRGGNNNPSLFGASLMGRP